MISQCYKEATQSQHLFIYNLNNVHNILFNNVILPDCLKLFCLCVESMVCLLECIGDVSGLATADESQPGLTGVELFIVTPSWIVSMGFTTL